MRGMRWLWSISCIALALACGRSASRSATTDEASTPAVAHPVAGGPTASVDARPPPPLDARGAGRKVDFAFPGADGASLFRVLADVGKRTIVVGADPGLLAFRARRAPLDGL